jgi:hypothetical protein
MVPRQMAACHERAPHCYCRPSSPAPRLCDQRELVLTCPQPRLPPPSHLPPPPPSPPLTRRCHRCHWAHLWVVWLARCAVPVSTIWTFHGGPPWTRPRPRVAVAVPGRAMLAPVVLPLSASVCRRALLTAQLRGPPWGTVGGCCTVVGGTGVSSVPTPSPCRRCTCHPCDPLPPTPHCDVRPEGSATDL